MRSDYGFFQLLQGLLEDASWCCHIQSHEAFTARTKHFAIVQCQMCLVDEEVEEGIV